MVNQYAVQQGIPRMHWQSKNSDSKQRWKGQKSWGPRWPPWRLSHAHVKHFCKYALINHQFCWIQDYCLQVRLKNSKCLLFLTYACKNKVLLAIMLLPGILSGEDDVLDCSVYLTDIDECTDDNPCRNNANCTNNVGSYFCNCTTGFAGKNCTEGRKLII